MAALSMKTKRLQKLLLRKHATSMIAAALNLLVFVSISHFRKLHTPTNLLLLSLAVSDFFVGLLLLFQLMLIDGCWYLGDLMCVLYYVLDIVITSASIGNMVLISIDRYVAICDPLHYHTRVTLKRVQICVSLCWICSFIYDIVILKDNFNEPGRFNSCSGECVIYIIVLYLRVFVVAVSQIRAMRSHAAAAAQKPSGKVTVKQSEMKAAGTLGVVVVVFLICLFRYFGVLLSDHGSMLNTLSVLFVICLFYFSSCLNPLIYALFYPWFRKSIKLIVTFEILKPGSRDANIVQSDIKKFVN
ncbi:LOW QUALITY PROTEIN: trace amine-associated receptor 8-like [Xenentodon cancila]